MSRFFFPHNIIRYFIYIYIYTLLRYLLNYSEYSPDFGGVYIRIVCVYGTLQRKSTAEKFYIHMYRINSSFDHWHRRWPAPEIWESWELFHMLLLNLPRVSCTYRRISQSWLLTTVPWSDQLETFRALIRIRWWQCNNQ